jgi:hypothetical protein
MWAIRIAMSVRKPTARTPALATPNVGLRHLRPAAAVRLRPTID